MPSLLFRPSVRKTIKGKELSWKWKALVCEKCAQLIENKNFNRIKLAEERKFSRKRLNRQELGRQEGVTCARDTEVLLSSSI